MNKYGSLIKTNKRKNKGKRNGERESIEREKEEVRK
jgi:hypothetical protein